MEHGRHLYMYIYMYHKESNFANMSNIHFKHSTVHVQCRFPINPILIIQTLDYPNAWTSPCFRQQREKDFLVTGVLLPEKAKLLYEQVFPVATIPFSSSIGVRSRFTTSELAERSRKRYSTLY